MLLARKGYRVLLLDRASFPSHTMSTHWIQQSGAARLADWGLLDEVRATGCPPIEPLGVDILITPEPEEAMTATGLRARRPSASDSFGLR